MSLSGSALEGDKLLSESALEGDKLLSGSLLVGLGLVMVRVCWSAGAR
jgi:hypothetical protein